ncbi:peptidoglycan recognition protein family protein [Streptomyces sp. NPDC054802]
MATPLTADQLVNALRGEGLRVIEHRSWRTHNRNHQGPWGPMHGVMIHHTVTAGTQSSVDLCYGGHSSLPGPLCHGVIDKDGTVYLVGNGRANHAGLGDDDVLRAVINESSTLPADNEANTDGNRHFYGFECVNLGDGKDPWPAAQLEAIEKAAAAICRAHRWNHRSVIGHLEWQPGKVDPRGFSMNLMRSRIADRLGSTPTTPAKESGMSAADDLKRLLHTDGVIPAANTAADRKTNKYWVWQTHITDNTNRIRAIHEEAIPALAAKIDQLEARPLSDGQIAAIAEAVARHPALADAIADKLAARLRD